MAIRFGGREIGQGATDDQVSYAMTLLRDCGYSGHLIGPSHRILLRRLGLGEGSTPHGTPVESWVRSLRKPTASDLIDHLKEELREFGPQR